MAELRYPFFFILRSIHDSQKVSLSRYFIFRSIFFRAIEIPMR